MPYKIMMSLASAVPLLFAIAFLAVPHFFILGSYPNAEGLALEVGITLIDKHDGVIRAEGSN